jgi:hypothetical protein
MKILKNNLGVTYVMDSKTVNKRLLGTYSGSSLNRKKKMTATRTNEPDTTFEEITKRNVLSRRSKAKIRTKILALSGVCKYLTFVTLTFVNQVDDKLAVQILKAFLENARKRKPELEYLWVAEKQTKNKVFTNNIHFHLVTNVFWNIERYAKYWIELQARYGIVPRENKQAGSSAFDVKKINSNNKKGIGNYIAGYLGKSSVGMNCRVWHCSRKISRLYTGFYSDEEFLGTIERMEKANLLGGTVKRFENDFCDILLIPFNSTTARLYEKVHIQNRTIWFCSN